jgi:hypothetical protein
VPPFALPPTAHQRRTLAAATAFGAVGVASLPLVLAYPSDLPPYLLSLACPAALALVGEATATRWLRTAGVAVLLLGAGAPVLGFGVLLAALAFLGPLAVVLVLGAAIRAIDPTAGTAFLSASAIAIAGGFAGGVTSPPIVAGVTLLVLAGGAVTTIARVLDAD